MLGIRRKLVDFIQKRDMVKNFNYNKFLFYFLLDLKNKLEQFKMNINTKCLVLSPYPGAETKGLGGLIAQYPKNFEVLCLTNGCSLIEGVNPVEAQNIKKQQFQDVMKTMRVKGSKIFDIDDKTLKNQYSTFKKIDISEADYIFIPNVYDNDMDTVALLAHFKQLLKEKEYKPSLKIIMFESDYPISRADCFVNIDSIVETKRKMLNEYYPKDKYPALVDKVIGLNAFRSISHKGEYLEVFMMFSVDEFMKIPMI